MRVFLIGVTGRVGRLLASQLVDLGDEVRGLVRREDQRDQARGRGIDAQRGDLTTISVDELADAYADSDVVVYCAGTDGDDLAMIDALDRDAVITALDAVERAGIRRFLLISVMPEGWRERTLGVELEHYFATKKRIDVAVSRRDLDWLILRSSELNDLPGTGSVALGAAEVHETIPRADVAATIAALVHAPEMTRRILEVNQGDTAVADAVARLAADVGDR